MMRYGDKRKQHIQMVCPPVRTPLQKTEEQQEKVSVKQS